jgi:hypothetical protein
MQSQFKPGRVEIKLHGQVPEGAPAHWARGLRQGTRLLPTPGADMVAVVDMDGDGGRVDVMVVGRTLRNNRTGQVDRCAWYNDVLDWDYPADPADMEDGSWVLPGYVLECGKQALAAYHRLMGTSPDTDGS